MFLFAHEMHIRLLPTQTVGMNNTLKWKIFDQCWLSLLSTKGFSHHFPTLANLEESPKSIDIDPSPTFDTENQSERLTSQNQQGIVTIQDKKLLRAWSNMADKKGPVKRGLINDVCDFARKIKQNVGNLTTLQRRSNSLPPSSSLAKLAKICKFFSVYTKRSICHPKMC